MNEITKNMNLSGKRVVFIDANAKDQVTGWNKRDRLVASSAQVKLFTNRDFKDPDALIEQIEVFKPDVVVVFYPDLRKSPDIADHPAMELARDLKKIKKTKVLIMDNFEPEFVEKEAIKATGAKFYDLTKLSTEFGSDGIVPLLSQFLDKKVAHGKS